MPPNVPTNPDIKTTDYDYDSPIVPVLTPEQQATLGFDVTTPGLSWTERQRRQQRLQWQKYWDIRRKENENAKLFWVRYKAQSFLEPPVSWFRERIVEPLQDRYRQPYYQRRLDRVPEIDQCGNQDRVCIWEANEQYRLDKMVDSHIVLLLRERMTSCSMYENEQNYYKCARMIEDFQQADLNFFIKYGEIGAAGTDVVDAYMKQKHRLIWERRHPAVMAERRRRMAEHEQALREGKFDMRFWSRLGNWIDKTQMCPSNVFGQNWKKDLATFEADQPISKDWRYYKRLSQDVDFDRRNYPMWLNEAAAKAKEYERQQQNGGGGK